MEPNQKQMFEKIYENLSDRIFRFCFVRVSDREQALEITQDTFLRLWLEMQKGKTIENSRAFLFTITNRLIIDWYRKKKSIPLTKLKINDEDFDQIDEKETERMELGAEGRYLIEKINELPVGYREPVYLRFVEDLSPPEIAKILGITVNACSVRINRGLVELRKKAGYDNKEK